MKQELTLQMMKIVLSMKMSIMIKYLMTIFLNKLMSIKKEEIAVLLRMMLLRMKMEMKKAGSHQATK